MSICEVFTTFQEIPPSLSSGCVGGLVAPNLMTGCRMVRYVCLRLAGRGMECDPSR